MENQEILKDYICKKHKSVRKFCIKFDLKYSTVVAMLSRGLNNANIDTVFDVCKALNIYVEPLVQHGIIMPKEVYEAAMTPGERDINAFIAFFRIMAESGKISVDKIPIDSSEKETFIEMMEAAAALIKKRRKETNIK